MPREKGRFVRGHSGNPQGKPKGVRNRTTAAAMALLDGASVELTEKLVELARDGDIIALRLVIDRVLPVRRDRTVELDGLRRITNATEIIEAADVVIRKAAAGEITLEEAAGFLRLVEQQRKAIETSELAVRLQVLESQLATDEDRDPRGPGARLDPYRRVR